MAVVKVNYIRAKSPKARQKIKATLYYISHRLDKEGRAVQRALFSHQGEVDKDYAYQLMDQADDNTYLYRIIISPDPHKEDEQKTLDLWSLTQATVLKLENHLGYPVQFVAGEHSDQTEIRHVHAIVILPEKLNVMDLQALREAATEAASRKQRAATLSYGLEQPTGEPRPDQTRPWMPHARPLNAGIPCPVCTGRMMYKVAEGVYRCPSCFLVLGLGRGLERRERQLEV
jgi:hypothetical protein